MHIRTSLKRYFTVNRRDIAYLRFIIESYEGLSTLSTVDAAKGTVSLSVPSCFADDVDGLVRALENEIEIKETLPPHGTDCPGEFSGGGS